MHDCVSESYFFLFPLQTRKNFVLMSNAYNYHCFVRIKYILLLFLTQAIDAGDKIARKKTQERKKSCSFIKETYLTLSQADPVVHSS